MAEGDLPASLKDALAAKGYDLVEGTEDSDSDGLDMLSNRIPSLAPDVAREKGKKAFEKGKYDKAIKYWQGGLKHILSSLCAGPHALQDMSLSELDLTFNLNIAMAYMKKQDYDAADKSVDKALARREALPPNLVTKALYRKAMAQRAMHRLDECLETLKELLEVEPGNAAAVKMQQEVDREWKIQIRQQKKNMKKLFGALSAEDKEADKALKEARAKVREACAVTWIKDEDIDSEAFALGEAPPSAGLDWGPALSRTVLWAIEQFAVEGSYCLPKDSHMASVWFLGASSTCELRLLQPATFLSRLPSIKQLEVALIGFLGDVGPDNKRELDPRDASLPVGLKQSSLPGDRKIMFQVVKGTLQEALEKDLKPAGAKGEDAEQPAEQVEGAAAASEDEPPPAPAGLAADGQLSVPPHFCVIAHPQLHRYFSDFYPAITWLIQKEVPTIVIGASEPDPSWKQDEVLLRALGCNVVVSKRESPYPMCLKDDPKVRKCNHIIGFCGGKTLEREKLVRTKLDLLAQDYQVR